MDRSEIKIEAGKCHILLSIPAYFDECTIPKMKRMFVLIHRYNYQNEQAIKDLESCMKSYSDELNAIWGVESKAYQRNYRDPRDARTKELAYPIKNNNEKLLNKVKRAKRQYDRFQKIIGYWNDIKVKYS